MFDKFGVQRPKRLRTKRRLSDSTLFPSFLLFSSLIPLIFHCLIHRLPQVSISAQPCKYAGISPYAFRDIDSSIRSCIALLIAPQ
jgi:hypothetical protein